jgi:hypothetical protein
MSPILGANPLDYDAKYPQKADCSVNEDARIEVMAKNIGKEVLLKTQDNQTYGKIIAVFGANKYIVSLKGISESLIVPESMLNFVEDIGTKI